MNSEKIVWNLMDSFQNQLRPTQALELSLQLLAWVKLSLEGKIPTQLSFDEENKPTSAWELIDIFEKLNHLGELGDASCAFRNIGADVDDVSVLQAFDVLQDVIQAGFVNGFKVPESLYQSLSDREIGEWFIPEEVADLIVRLAGDLKGKDVYCPYDNLDQLARRVNQLGGEPSVELSTKLSFFWLTNILSNMSINATIGEPIKNPAFTEKGELKRFDISLTFPPMGKKADKDIIDRDFFNRFPYSTSSWSVLAIWHILAQTKEKAIIIVPNNILFSSGVERALREDLLKKGFIETVICFPPAILPSTGIKISILMLSQKNPSDSVRFVDASAEAFSAKDGRGRSRLVDLEALLETIHHGKDESVAVTVSTQ